MLRIVVKWIVIPILLVSVLLGCFIWFVSQGTTGARHARGAIASQPIPATAVADRSERRQRAQTAIFDDTAPSSQILFGDLHVHTTYSADAFVFSLPLIQGEGVHPPADACDFARFCAELDFWSINDHAETLLPWQWSEITESIRECNAVAGDADNPDTVAFLGWEWTQSAPAAIAGDRIHYGHKNVVLRDTEDGNIPTRPISAGAGGLFSSNFVPRWTIPLIQASLTLGDLGNLEPYLDFYRYTGELSKIDYCDPDKSVRDLPANCIEGAATPDLLFEKLDDWGFPSIVIPHGTAWGVHAPPQADLARQLEPGMHDPKRQRLFEVFSGHGNSEQWRDTRDTAMTDGGKICAPPQPNYLPCCWRAGELIRERCGDIPTQQCEERVNNARQWYVDAAPGTQESVVPGATPDDWLECGQLSDSFQPSYQYRTRMSAQYGLAIRPNADSAFRYGLIGSSDNHKARAGPGYKEIGRKAFGDAYGVRLDWWNRIRGAAGERLAEPVPPAEAKPKGFDPGSERSASFYYTSGLVAVHSPSRRRGDIFEALEKRHAYGTSGPRILLWFDLENAPGAPARMGSDVDLSQPPRFTVRAVGSFEQKPGCPQHTLDRLAPERLDRLCLNECYHPSDSRHTIERIEVVRIRPQIDPDEDVDTLIEDPWKTIACPSSQDGCSITFEDPEYTGEREHLYYVRALQEPTDAINGDPMRCQRNADGKCIKARFCPASGPTFDPDDECLAPVNERAWSSPIWIRRK